MGLSQSVPIAIASESVVDIRNGEATLNELVEAMSSSAPGVRGINLLMGQMDLPESTLRTFCRIVQRNPSLIHNLSIKNSRIPPSTSLSFSSCVHALISLELDNAGVNEQTLSAIGRRLPSTRRLRKLAINNDKASLQQASFLTFIEGVAESNVRDLQLCDNGIPDLEAAEMCRLLSGSKLESLSLDGNEIGVWGARAVSDLLSQPGSRLRSLRVSRNSICVDGAAALASMIVQNVTLEELDLTANPITDAGVERITSSLEVNMTLSVLKLPLAESRSLNEIARLRQVLQRNRNYHESAPTADLDGYDSVVAG